MVQGLSLSFSRPEEQNFPLVKTCYFNNVFLFEKAGKTLYLRSIS